MKMREDIRPVTYLKSKAADLLEQLNRTHRPVVITQNGEVGLSFRIRKVMNERRRLLD